MSSLDTLYPKRGGGDACFDFLSRFLYGLFAHCPFFGSLCLLRFVMAVTLWLVFSFIAVVAHAL